MENLLLISLTFMVTFYTLTNGHLTYIAIRLPLQGKRALPGSPWPHPKHLMTFQTVYTLDPQTFGISSNFDECSIINKAVERYRNIIFLEKDGGPDSKSVHCSKLVITIQNKTCEQWPHLSMDETYEIDVDETAHIRSESIWGALRGLETFSQLVYFSQNKHFINGTTIRDGPRFPHRGLMLDTARHFYPVSTLLKNLDAMAYNKLNVFHWHIVDDQSFPYESTTYPELTKKGAYNPESVYNQKDVKRVIEYARDRGIRVVVEFDTPGHSQSWGKSHRELLTPCWVDGVPGKSLYNYHGAYELMDPTRNSTFEFLDNFFTEIVSTFPDEFVHLGMDESYHSCWMSNPHVKEFINKTLGLDAEDIDELEQYYVKRIIDLVLKKQSKIVIWQDPLDKGLKTRKDVLVQVWKNTWQSDIQKIVKMGNHVVLSSCWYLNFISYGQDWKNYYTCDPFNFTGTDEEKELVVGGEACLWSEYVDSTNVLQRVWPRASAVAERLWSDKSLVNTDDAAFRLDKHRCRMLRRGIPAEPILDGYCDNYEVPSRHTEPATSSSFDDRRHDSVYYLLTLLVLHTLATLH